MKRISAVYEVLLAKELEPLLEKPSNPVPKPKWAAAPGRYQSAVKTAGIMKL